jgi:hypothetical protein
VNSADEDLIIAAPRTWWDVSALTRRLTGAFLFAAATCAGFLVIPLATIVFASYFVARKAAAHAFAPREQSLLRSENHRAV